MFSTSLPLGLQVLLGCLAVLFSGASFVGLWTGVRYINRSRQVTINNTLADSAVASLTAANQGLESRLDLVEQDNKHCHDMKAQQDITIEAQSKRIDDLTKWVTARDLVIDLTAMTQAGFLALDVDPKALSAAVAAVDTTRGHP